MYGVWSILYSVLLSALSWVTSGEFHCSRRPQLSFDLNQQTEGKKRGGRHEDGFLEHARSSQNGKGTCNNGRKCSAMRSGAKTEDH